MKRLLILFALAGLSTATACGSDSGGSSADDDDDDDSDDDNDESTGKKDAGKTSGKDAGASTVESRGEQIENLADACESVEDCKGEGALSCITDFFGFVMFPGGACTAGCRTDDECGEGGACPLAAILSNPAFAAFGGGMEATCMKTCEDSCGREDEGYQCTKLTDLFSGIPGAGGFIGPLLGPAGSQSFCLPPIDLTIPDAGPVQPPPTPSDAGSKPATDGGISGGLDSGRPGGDSGAARLDAGRDTGR